MSPLVRLLALLPPRCRSISAQWQVAQPPASSEMQHRSYTETADSTTSTSPSSRLTPLSASATAGIWLGRALEVRRRQIVRHFRRVRDLGRAAPSSLACGATKEY